MTEVARHIRPAPYLQRMGNAIAGGMPPVYNGLHLRMEKDANYVRKIGGEEVRMLSVIRHLSAHHGPFSAAEHRRQPELMREWHGGACRARPQSMSGCASGEGLCTRVKRLTGRQRKTQTLDSTPSLSPQRVHRSLERLSRLFLWKRKQIKRLNEILTAETEVARDSACLKICERHEHAVVGHSTTHM